MIARPGWQFARICSTQFAQGVNMKNIDTGTSPAKRSSYALDDLLHPANAFARPCRVVDDPGLSLCEKRAILAAWASDACAVEAAPALRRAPGAAQPVLYDEVMDALRTLDGLANGFRSPPRYRRVLANRIPGVFERKSGGSARPIIA
jgi:hypothetical protein